MTWIVIFSGNVGERGRDMRKRAVFSLNSGATGANRPREELEEDYSFLFRNCGELCANLDLANKFLVDVCNNVNNIIM